MFELSFGYFMLKRFIFYFWWIQKLLPFGINLGVKI